MDWRMDLMQGDCLEMMAELDDASVDSIVTDPPYGLSFMGKRWDYDVPSVEIWAECLRVLKPGGHLLAFAGTRTQHRMAVRIEDAGFEIRDMIAWVYGSGFPKSHNGEWGGTAFKPALEPITVARKPLIGTVAQNFAAHGTGGLNIDGCRVGAEGGTTRGANGSNAGKARNTLHGGNFGVEKLDAGRWPANLIHDGSDEVTGLFPQSKGQQGDVRGDEPSAPTQDIYGKFAARVPAAARGDTGSAARFFYCAKASKRDRDDGLDGFQAEKTTFAAGTGLRNNGDGTPRSQAPSNKNTHPTVKPTDLMRYLCRLVTPPGGIVLDPFMGSGSTGKAAILEGFRFIGIEREADYMDIAEARITAAMKVADGNS